MRDTAGFAGVGALVVRGVGEIGGMTAEPGAVLEPDAPPGAVGETGGTGGGGVTGLGVDGLSVGDVGGTGLTGCA